MSRWLQRGTSPCPADLSLSINNYREGPDSATTRPGSVSSYTCNVSSSPLWQDHEMNRGVRSLARQQHKVLARDALGAVEDIDAQGRTGLDGSDLLRKAVLAR